MEKVLKHIKNNAIIYLIALLCLIVVLIVVFMKPQPELEKVDTSLFNVVSLDNVKKMFQDNKARFLLISKDDNQATVSYAKTLQYSSADAKYKYKVYYLELNSLTKKEKEELNELLDLEKITDSQGKSLDEILEQIPLNIIIKNNKIAYAYVGPMNLTTLDSLVTAYGVGEKDA